MLSIVRHRFFEGGALPDAYEADGMGVALNTDFRVWLRYDYLRVDHVGMTDEEFAWAVIGWCCKSSTPDASPDFIMQAITWFHSCADSERISRITVTPLMRETIDRSRLSCLFWDFKAIWDSFKQQYDMDLFSCGEIHWWEFLRLLKGLKADTPYAQLKHMRGVSRADFLHDDKGMKSERQKEWSLLVCEREFMAFPEKW